MDNQMDNSKAALEQRLDEQLNPSPGDVLENAKPVKKEEELKVLCESSEKDMKVLGVGEWMLTIFFFIIPIINIIMMAYWAFSSRGNVNRRNMARAGLLWLIILLIAYVVAMTAAGFTPFMIFGNK